MLVRVTGSGYRGVLAIAKDPSRLNVENSAGVGTYGQLTGDIASAHNGILATPAPASLTLTRRATGATATAV